MSDPNTQPQTPPEAIRWGSTSDSDRAIFRWVTAVNDMYRVRVQLDIYEPNQLSLVDEEAMIVLILNPGDYIVKENDDEDNVIFVKYTSDEFDDKFGSSLSQPIIEDNE